MWRQPETSCLPGAHTANDPLDVLDQALAIETAEADRNTPKLVTHDRTGERIDEIVRWRREHQPGGQNAGSVFVNPVPGELAAAQLIDGLGLKGFRIGGAFVSEKHANFVQAEHGATSADVRAVIEHVRDEVFEKTGFLLRSEVRLVGFDDVEPDHREGVAL